MYSPEWTLNNVDRVRHKSSPASVFTCWPGCFTKKSHQNISYQSAHYALIKGRNSSDQGVVTMTTKIINLAAILTFKKSIIAVILISSTMLVLSACSTEYTEQINTSTAQLALAEDSIYEADGISDTIKYVDYNTDNTSNLIEDVVYDIYTYSSSDAFGAVPVTLLGDIFVGEGETIATGGDSLEWYHHPFGGVLINSICCHYVAFVGDDAFIEWVHQFESHGEYGWRNRREANFRTFLADFGISIETIIQIEEEMSGLPIGEIDALVTWARGLDIPSIECDDEAWEVVLWTTRRSLREIEALFSDDIYFVWTTFPGSGVFHNGNVYSPEWILNNMDRAISEEQIPLHEIDRILGHAVYHSELDEVRFAAETTLQAVR